MPAAGGFWFAGLSRSLRLAGLLSATASLSSSSSTTKRSMVNVSYTLPRRMKAGVIRASPGFVSSSRTSTCSLGGEACLLTQAHHAHISARPTARYHMLSSNATPTHGIQREYLRSPRSMSDHLTTARYQILGPMLLKSVRRSSSAAVTPCSARQGDAVEIEKPRLDDGHSSKINLLDMSQSDVEAFMKSIGEPKYRADQVVKWIYNGGALSFDDMTNLPKALRAKLQEVATIGVLEIAAQQTSKDGTRKRAYRLADGQLIESVLMPYSDGRRTACISSQAGCAMGCVFCATGQMGFKRQLTSVEIFEQAYRFAQELAAKGERLSNVGRFVDLGWSTFNRFPHDVSMLRFGAGVLYSHDTVRHWNMRHCLKESEVFMGMGEPLANYNTVMESVRRINEELGIGARHITISTVGLVPRILRLAQEDIQVKLAVSLHAANDAERSALIPANRRFPLGELMVACKEYVDVTGRRMTFEWALIHGENDSVEVAAELGRLLRPLKGMCHVNIIPLNPTTGYDGGPAIAEAVDQFVSVLAHYGVPATPRVRRGIDIDAGCGQLTSKVNQEDVLGKGL